MVAETGIGSSRSDGSYGPGAPVLSRVTACAGRRRRTGDLAAHGSTSLTALNSPKGRAVLQKAKLFVSWLGRGLRRRGRTRRSAHRSLATFPTTPPPGTLGETPANE